MREGGVAATPPQGRVSEALEAGEPGGSFPRNLEGGSPISALISDFWPTELQEKRRLWGEAPWSAVIYHDVLHGVREGSSTISLFLQKAPGCFLCSFKGSMHPFHRISAEAAPLPTASK